MPWLLDERDPMGEIRGWLVAIAEMLQPLVVSRPRYKWFARNKAETG